MFNADNKIGKRGESIVRMFLESKGFTVTDVSKVKEWQKMGVDFIAEFDGQPHRVEVKYCSIVHRSGNISLENHCITTGKLGWFQTSQTEWLFIVSQVTGDIIIVHMDDLRDYVHTHECKHYRNYDKQYNGTTNEWENILIPINDFSKYYTVERRTLGGAA